MTTLHQIVAVLDDGMRPSAALRRAAHLARRSGAHLHLLMCAHDSMIDISRDLANGEVHELAKTQYLAIRRRWLHEQAAALADTGLQVDCEVIWTPEAHEAVIAYALTMQPDLVVRDLMPSRKAAMRMPLTAVDWRIARTCPAPLMFVRQNGPLVPNRIAAAIDVGMDHGDSSHPLNELITRAALGVATYSDAELHVVHAFPYRRPALTVEISGDLRALYSDVRQCALDNFQRFTREHSIANDRQHWIEASGEVASAIERFVQSKEVDLLVIGSSYRSILSRLLLGSASESLLRKADFDVLLVKPADFVEQLGRHYDLREIKKRNDSECIRDDLPE
jgi:universal stress protein E